MERKEKKKRKDYKGRRQTRSTPSFPIDLTSEILLRLPEKSVARFRCMSKLWSSITTDPYFINLFETRSPRPSLLLCIPQHTQHTLHPCSNKSFSSSKPISCYHMKFPEDDGFMNPTESVHGLICFQESLKLIVWNPIKKEFLTLPKPRKIWIYITVFLGYDPSEGKHKVMCIPCNRTSDVCRVLTLGSPQESWRTVKTNQKHPYIYHIRIWVIMSFDVRFEKFHMIPLPLEARKNLLLNYKGRLSFVDHKNPRKLLILEDAEKHKWSKHDFLSHLGRDLITERSLQLKGFTHAGELVYVASLFNKPSYILFCNPVRNTFRRFEFKGISEDES
ncbi:hypothetical protein N665_0102s0061 [Sinapis alba]|nr:hypothetical protein N665_0102s0061 [Sinapis alba]